MNRIFKKLSVERWTLSVERYFIALAAVTLAAARLAYAEPIQWGGGSPCGSFFLDDSETGCWVYEATIFNKGTSSADNMVSETLAAMNGVPLDIYAIYVNGWFIPWTVNADGSVALNYYVAHGGRIELEIWLQPGCSPGRLRLSAMAGNGGGAPIPFNDLIIGPSYVQPSLSLARLALPGPGTNAITLAISSDAEFLQLQYTDTLATTNWTDLARVAVTGAVTLATDTNTAPSRFYRAVVP